MKRLHFLTLLLSPLLALFRRKTKQAFFNDRLDPLFSVNTENYTITLDEPIKITTEAFFQVGGKEYKCPVPQDNDFHTFKIKYNKGEVEYYVDGKLESVAGLPSKNQRESNTPNNEVN